MCKRARSEPKLFRRAERLLDWTRSARCASLYIYTYTHTHICTHAPYDVVYQHSWGRYSTQSPHTLQRDGYFRTPISEKNDGKLMNNLVGSRVISTYVWRLRLKFLELVEFWGGVRIWGKELVFVTRRILASTWFCVALGCDTFEVSSCFLFYSSFFLFRQMFIASIWPRHDMNNLLNFLLL